MNTGNRPFAPPTPCPFGRRNTTAPQSILKAAGAITTVFLLLPAAAYGHPGHEWGGNPAHGFLHPLTGWDHLLAMLAIGIWSGRMGGRALCIVPGFFVTFLVAGALFAGIGAGAGIAETGVLASVFVLGYFALRATEATLRTAVILAAFFSIFHGYAHGLETAIAGHPAYWGAFLAGTLVVHSAGVGFGLMLRRAFPARHPVRLS